MVEIQHFENLQIMTREEGKCINFGFKPIYTEDYVCKLWSIMVEYVVHDIFHI